jgi:hypothetical protein
VKVDLIVRSLRCRYRLLRFRFLNKGRAVLRDSLLRITPSSTTRPIAVR